MKDELASCKDQRSNTSHMQLWGFLQFEGNVTLRQEILHRITLFSPHKINDKPISYLSGESSYSLFSSGIYEKALYP